jgi:hypothetical protein
MKYSKFRDRRVARTDAIIVHKLPLTPLLLRPQEGEFNLTDMTCQAG